MLHTFERTKNDPDALNTVHRRGGHFLKKSLQLLPGQVSLLHQIQGSK